MSKILGVDYGDARTGLAISDEEKKWAFGHSVLSTDEALVENIRSIAEDQDVELVVVGRPRLTTGNFGTQAEKSAEFVRVLEAAGLNVAFEDETGTSISDDDAESARLILQGYLDEREK